jgi:ATP-dependent helicase HrpA
MQPASRQPRHPRYDAIHRALLTGLLSNVGTKSDSHEFHAPRGVKFSIHPGSALFLQKPKWLVAAELVETTRLYARTCASVQPQWIEKAAAHLVDRTYSDPRWDSQTASAIATEKVTLHGLVLIPARSVPYSPINPRQSRELFIHHALVLGDFRSPAPFLRHNARLVEEIQRLEAKIRQKNLLADAATRFAFYDARVPQEVSSGAQFESWRRRAEDPKSGNPRLLFMDKADLLRADAPEITPQNFPDRLSEQHGNLHLPLTYKFEPADAADGLTLAVPVAALAQLHPQRYEWLVPGMLEEKIAAMLRELPGNLRRNFVPVPAWAKSAAEALAAIAPMERPVERKSPDLPSADAAKSGDLSKVADGKSGDLRSIPHATPSLREALAAYLGRQTGIEISPADFPEAALSPHLRMAFKVLADDGRILALSRDLPLLQRQLASHAADAFGTLYNRTWNRDGITGWDFPDLPESVHVDRFGMQIAAFPALLDRTDTCALRLLPQKDAAEAAHRAGVRRLFRLEFRREVKALAANLPHFPQMALEHFTLGESRQLREDLVTLSIDRALFAANPAPRTKAAWEPLKALAAARLMDVGNRTAALALALLDNYHLVSLALDTASQSPHRTAPAYADVREQLLHLIPAHFLLTTPFEWLEQFPRYLGAAKLRLEKLESRADPAAARARDEQSMALFTPWWTQYLHRRNLHQQIALHDPELTHFRWLLEEYRVHLFAQELGTAQPVSPRRLEKQWEKTQRPA